MKQIGKILALLLALLALAGCQTFFGGSRESGKNHLKMEYSILNTHDEEIFKLDRGDVVVGDIVNDSGTLRVTIQQIGGAAVYDDEDAATGHIEVEIEEPGSYWVSVVGDGAKGSVEFSVQEAP